MNTIAILDLSTLLNTVLENGLLNAKNLDLLWPIKQGLDIEKNKAGNILYKSVEF